MIVSGFSSGDSSDWLIKEGDEIGSLDLSYLWAHYLANTHYM